MQAVTKTRRYRLKSSLFVVAAPWQLAESLSCQYKLHDGELPTVPQAPPIQAACWLLEGHGDEGDESNREKGCGSVYGCISSRTGAVQAQGLGELFLVLTAWRRVET